MTHPVSKTLLIVALGAAWLGFSAASDALSSPAPPPNDTCTTSGFAQKLAQDSQAFVYSVPMPGERPTSTARERREVLGCSLATGKVSFLGTTVVGADQPTIDPRTVALSSHWVVYSLTVHGEDGNTVSVTLRNLETGKVKRRRRAEPRALGVEHFSKVMKLGVNRGGAFAWISTGSSIGGGEAREVAAVRASGRFVVLDTAADIDPRSLKLRGNLLSWTDGGVRHTASLFAPAP